MSSLKPLHRPAPKAVRRNSVAKQAPPNRRSLLVFYGLLGLTAILIAALVIRGRANGAVGPSNVSVDQAVRPLNASVGQTDQGYWYKGDADAPVTVMVFGDFQCPACLAAYEQIEGGIDTNYVETGKIKFVFHDFPLTMHANAVPAAQAARAAGAQGKFWQMHDLLYARQSEWENLSNSDVIARFKSYAAELGLDQSAFNQALDNGTYAAVITAAINDGNAQGINATPTYLVDGQQTDAGSLTAAIDAALKAKGR
jgi:protein-disulfide isomerase